MDRREFLKTCAALGVAVAVPVAVVVRSVAVKLGRPSDLVADNLGLTVVSDTHVGGWEPVGFSPFDSISSDTHFASRPGRIYFVPGNADTIAEAFQLAVADADEWQKWRWSAGCGIPDGDAGAIRDLEQWGEL